MITCSPENVPYNLAKHRTIYKDCLYSFGQLFPGLSQIEIATVIKTARIEADRIRAERDKVRTADFLVGIGLDVNDPENWK